MNRDIAYYRDRIAAWPELADLRINADMNGHPLQYAFVTGLGSPDAIVYGTEQMDDDRVLDALYGKVPMGVERMLRHRAAYRSQIRVERYNRCPTCEQWSPCDVRKTAP